jgi:hypothetical protein
MGALAAVAPVFGLVVAAGLVLGSSATAEAVGAPGHRTDSAPWAASPFVVGEPPILGPSPAGGPAIDPTAIDPAARAGAAPTVPSAEEELAAQLARQPLGAKVVGNKISYGGGAAVFVAIDAGTLSMSSCGADRFCVWDRANFQGSLWSLAGTGGTYSMPGYLAGVGSVWNRRGGRTLMFPSTGQATPSYCYGAGTSYASVTGTASVLRAAFLSSYPSC